MIDRAKPCAAVAPQGWNRSRLRRIFRRDGDEPQSTRLDLKRAPPASKVVELGRCKDAYAVTVADGKTRKIWECNPRFRTDSSKFGPRKGRPVIAGAGMQGDRSSLVFALLRK